MIGNAKPVAEVVPEGQTKLFAGLHEAEHVIAGDTPIPALGAAGDFAFDDATAQIVLGGIGAQRDFGSFNNLEPFFLAAQQAG